MTKKGRQFFLGEMGVTPSVAAPGDTTLVTPMVIFKAGLRPQGDK